MGSRECNVGLERKSVKVKCTKTYNVIESSSAEAETECSKSESKM